MVYRKKTLAFSLCDRYHLSLLVEAHFYFKMEKIERVLITPEIATKMLEKNVGNRAISKPHLDFLTNQMSNGQWMYAADPIRIATNGKVLDGQHRLTAIVKSGKSLEMLVVSDLDESVFSVIDTGKGRSAGDVLSIASFSNAKLRASVARMILAYENGLQAFLRTRDSGITTGGGNKDVARITNAIILSFVENIDLDDDISIAQKCSKSFRMLSASEYGFFHYIFKRLSADAAHEFLTKLSTGLNLSENDPILMLRNKLITESVSSIRVSSRIKLILILKCWNYYRKGESIKILQYTTQQEIPVPI